MLGHIEALEWFVEHGARIDVWSWDEHGVQPIHVAAFGGLLLNSGVGDIAPQFSRDFEASLKTVKWLIDHNVSINVRSKWSWQPIHEAARGGNVKVLTWIVERGVRIRIKTNEGEQPIHFAAEGGHLDVIKWLVSHDGSNKEETTSLPELINVADNEGLQPIHYAAAGDQAECLAWLVAHGADVHVQTHDGRLPLHFATEGGYTDALKWLVDHAERAHEHDEL